MTGNTVPQASGRYTVPSQQGTKSLHAAAKSVQVAKSHTSLSHQQQQASKSISSGRTQIQASKSVASSTHNKQGTKGLSPSSWYPQASQDGGISASQLHGTKSNTPLRQGSTMPQGSAIVHRQDSKSLDLATSQSKGDLSGEPATSLVQGSNQLDISHASPQSLKPYNYGAKQPEGPENPNPIPNSQSQGQGLVPQQPDGTSNTGLASSPEHESKTHFSTSMVQAHSSKSYNYATSSAKSASSMSSYTVQKHSSGSVAAPVQEGSPVSSLTSDDRRPEYDYASHRSDSQTDDYEVLLAQDRKSMLAGTADATAQADKTTKSFRAPWDSTPMSPDMGGAKNPSPGPGLPDVTGKSIWSPATLSLIHI